MAPMPDRPSLGSVDTPHERSISFARPASPPDTARDRSRSPIPVGPGRIAGATPSRSAHLSDEGSGYPIQLGKVQRPALRDETLERPRLLDWLRLKVHGRVVLILADAGYGKTTLLADFSRRTRMRTLWYRLDPRRPRLGHAAAPPRRRRPRARSRLRAGDGGVPGGDGTGRPEPRRRARDLHRRTAVDRRVGGAVLIFDDFHLVDDAPDARHIARELVANAPERLSIVFASRRAPAIPLSKLRAVGRGRRPRHRRSALRRGGDRATLHRDVRAAARSRRARRPRHPDRGLDRLTAVGPGCPARPLAGRDPAVRPHAERRRPRSVRLPRRGSRGDLEDELQRFLMETSILQVVTPELAEVVSGRDAGDVARLTATAERLTLLSRISGAPRTHQRYHPLVRELPRGADAVTGRAGCGRGPSPTGRDRLSRHGLETAAHHYREAGDTEAMLGVVASAIPTIMGDGQYALAEGFIGPISADRRPAGFDLILSRVDMQQGDYDAAIAASQAVLDSGIDRPSPARPCAAEPVGRQLQLRQRRNRFGI